MSRFAVDSDGKPLHQTVTQRRPPSTKRDKSAPAPSDERDKTPSELDKDTWQAQFNKELQRTTERPSETIDQSVESRESNDSPNPPTPVAPSTPSKRHWLNPRWIPVGIAVVLLIAPLPFIYQARYREDPTALTETRGESKQAIAASPISSVAEAVPPTSSVPASALVQTYALLVGVSEYDYCATLPNPVSDVRALDKDLRETYGVETSLLLNPDRQTFLKALYDLAKMPSEPNSQLLVFFAGHGWFDETVRKGYIALKDSRMLVDDPFGDTLVAHEVIRSILERLDNPHVLLMLDSCFGGTLDPVIAMAPINRGEEASYRDLSPKNRTGSRANFG